MKEDRKNKRQCVICREYKEKDKLIRITKESKSGEIKVNQDSKYQGRSLYICKNKECIDKLMKSKRADVLPNAETAEKIKEEVYTVLKN